jgi:hypothetical protein
MVPTWYCHTKITCARQKCLGEFRAKSGMCPLQNYLDQFNSLSEVLVPRTIFKLLYTFASTVQVGVS